MSRFEVAFEDGIHECFESGVSLSLKLGFGVGLSESLKRGFGEGLSSGERGGKLCALIDGYCLADGSEGGKRGDEVEAHSEKVSVVLYIII